jgi:8-oxo-dGTP diphosphatase
MALRKHYVATGYVYDKQADSFLLVLHRKLGKWLPPGGHLLEEEEPHRGALRELYEETGLEGRILDLPGTPDVGTLAVAQLAAPFCILSELIPASPKDEEHIHIDFVYALEVNLSETLNLCSEEVARAMWVSAEHIDEIDTFDNVRKVCQAISALCEQSFV